MKNFLLSAGLVLAMSATVSANPTFPNASMNNGLTAVQSPIQASLNECLSTESSSRAIRACSEALRLTPVTEVRSALYVKRAFLNLSQDKMKAASRDFKYAHKLGASPDYLRLGEGYQALMKGDTTRAVSIFDDCSGDKKTTSMAVYGRAIAKEMLGDKTGAAADYKYASELAPEWSAPSVEYQRIQGL